MKYFTVDLKSEFPALSSSKQEPKLSCYVSDFTPENRKNPAILIMPGGGYGCVCADREGDVIAYKYLSEGFSAFVLNYSVYPEHYPQQLFEAAAAMIYIKSHSDEFFVDPEKVVVSGFSAGGHLAASLGVFWNDPFVLDAFKAPEGFTRPSAMILGYPVITADPSFSNAGTINNVSGTNDVNAAIYKKMSLENQISENTPPAYIWHTANDEMVPVRNSIAFANSLAIHKIPFELHVFPNGPHGIATASYASNFTVNADFYYCYPWMDESIKFLKQLWY